ncbi:MAG: hypothetical protein AAGJ35_05020 [Myxococcota bacterium]
MVTSRDRGRWVMPKGWTMDGTKPWQAAKIEALEEAGAVGFVSDEEIGTYHYDKRFEKTRLVSNPKGDNARNNDADKQSQIGGRRGSESVRVLRKLRVASKKAVPTKQRSFASG